MYFGEIKKLLIGRFINDISNISRSPESQGKSVNGIPSFGKFRRIGKAFQWRCRLKLFGRYATSHNFALYTSNGKSRIIPVLTYFSTTFPLFHGIEKLAIMAAWRKIRASEFLFLIMTNLLF